MRKEKNYCECPKCGYLFSYRQEDTYWDESGIESVKITTCTRCGTKIPIQYWNKDFKNLNYDGRYYCYCNDNK